MNPQEPYKIKKGENLTKIAKQFGTTVQDLMKANPNIKDPNLIFTGASLNIPEQKVQANDPNALQGAKPEAQSTSQTATGIAPEAVTKAPQIAQQAKPSPTIFTSQKGADRVAEMTQGIQDIQATVEAPKTKLERAQEAEEGFLSESETAFKEMQTNLEMASQGKIPLTADEQADIDYIKAKLDSTRKAQEQLNKSIEGGTRILANITGGEFAPVRAQQMVQQAVQQGIDKINALDMDAAKALRDARTAIKDKNFKNLTESYKMVQDAMKQKGETLTKIREAAEEAEKDIRDFNYKLDKDKRDYDLQVKKYNLDVKKAAQEAGIGPVTIGDAVDTGYKQALSVILGSGKFTKDQKASIISAINSGEDPTIVIKNQAKNIMGQTEATTITKYETAKNALTDLQKALGDYYAKGGNTNVFKGKYEKVINKLGDVNNPDLVDIATQIQTQLQVYRNAVSGTAYSEQEGADIASIFPGINKTQGLNEAILKGRMKAFDSTIDGAYKATLGTAYDKIKETDKKLEPEKQTKSNVQEVAKKYPDQFRGAVMNFFTSKGRTPTLEEQQAIADYIAKNQ